MTLVLGIETSCDETAAAVVEDGRTVLLVGGVEPGRPARPLRRRGARGREPRARGAHHAGDRGGAGRGGRRARATSTRWPRATVPGLAGALLVGVSAAKALALVADLPYVGVNHLEAHLHAAWLEEPDLEPPLAVLIVSGGHTMTVDHGGPRPLPGGRPDRRRRRGRGVRQGGAPSRPRVPGRSGDRPPRARRRRRGRALPAGDARRAPTSRSPGSKTAVVNHAPHSSPTSPVADVAASFQEAVVDQLVAKLLAAADERGRARARPRGRRGGQLPAAGQGGGGRRGHRAAGVPPPAGALHRQRGDDRRHRLVAAPVRRPHPARRRRRPQPAPAAERSPATCRAGSAPGTFSTRTRRVLTARRAPSIPTSACRRRHIHESATARRPDRRPAR